MKPKKISKKIRKWLEKAEYNNIQEDFYKDWKVYLTIIEEMVKS